jgi:hypothetical protein
VWGVYSTTATTLSVSDVVHLFSLPEGAVVVDGYICGIIKSAGTVVKVGVQAGGNPSATGVSTDGDFIATVVAVHDPGVGALQRHTAGLPYQTAAIAAATYPKAIPVVLTVASGTVTASVSIGFSSRTTRRAVPSNPSGAFGGLFLLESHAVRELMCARSAPAITKLETSEGRNTCTAS